MDMKTLLAFLAAVALPLAVGGLAGALTAAAIPTWYAGLAKPPFNPPDWVFGPVWTALYVLMGIASFLVWRAGWERREVREALGLYAAQLVLNGLWSLLFFGAHSPAWALLDIAALVALVVATTIRFAAIRAPAGWLLVPYLAWIAFATVLNASIWWLNRA